MYASGKGHTAVVLFRTLVNAQCDLNAADDDGSTALVLASEEGHRRVVRMLLDAGATCENEYGDDPTALEEERRSATRGSLGSTLGCGYGIIKQFQDLYFQSNYAATEFTKVDFESIAKSYGMRAIRIDEERNLLGILKSIFEFDGPMLIDVSIDPDQKCVPKLEFGNALEHLSPFIPLDDLKSEMVVETAERKSMKGWVIPKPRGAE
ncbi:acetolactate synthasem [Pycnococcus provasolii]